MEGMDKHEDQAIFTDRLFLLADCVLKNSVPTRYCMQLQGTTIRTKSAPPYTILFVDYLEGKILNSFTEKPLVWW